MILVYSIIIVNEEIAAELDDTFILLFFQLVKDTPHESFIYRLIPV